MNIPRSFNNKGAICGAIFSRVSATLLSINHQILFHSLTSKMPSSVTSSPAKSHQEVEASPSKRMKQDLAKHALFQTYSTSAPTLKFSKLTENAYTPTRGSKLAAGYDLYSAYDAVVPAKGKVLVKTDIQIQLPTGCYGRVAPRSGLANKHFIDVGAGVIDEDYRGNVGVILFNFNCEDYKVCKGDRVAQLICEKIFYPELEEVISLTETERGSNGYGSTGTN